MNVAKLQAAAPDTLPTDLAALEAWFDRRLDEKLAEREANKVPSLCVIATKGTMDMAYPPFILASTASALGWNASIFFTFYGLELLRKDLHLKVSPQGNPAMPMKMPFGPDWLKRINMPIPNLVSGNLPGFESLATSLMEQTVKAKGVPSIKELRDICIESDVRLVACQMTVDLFNYRQDEFIPEIAEWIGATTYLGEARNADVCLFV
ncbi:NADH-quinone oxidoreductase subunit F [Parasulfuritortus cantonensis]|uniref:NADH-quinone oxidoreductase subunit F n=1 Tax=Parasulfuritortus cantonensis TaxID=2528202 RepID=A0A4R1BD05_9PROT|nr:DsrE/DsrF/DrsH-like family protein [Parasulfuritortus cantonensis]TCJ14966.1 NADH-quinone oxidoreductase subunit F [Parasulfuritortus cantonensis]